MDLESLEERNGEMGFGPLGKMGFGLLTGSGSASPRAPRPSCRPSRPSSQLLMKMAVERQTQREATSSKATSSSRRGPGSWHHEGGGAEVGFRSGLECSCPLLRHRRFFFEALALLVLCERTAMSSAQSPRGCGIKPVNACLSLQHFEN
jgi:hypothetical protein